MTELVGPEILWFALAFPRRMTHHDADKNNNKLNEKICQMNGM